MPDNSEKVNMQLACSNGCVVIPLETYNALREELAALKSALSSVVMRVYVNELGAKPTIEADLNDKLIAELIKERLHTDITDEQLVGFMISDKIYTWCGTIATKE